jgi:hypothetical protein
MLKFLVKVVVFVVVLVASILVIEVPGAMACDVFEASTSGCATATIHNGGVDVTASHGSPGSDSATGSGGTKGDVRGTKDDPISHPPRVHPAIPEPVGNQGPEDGLIRDGFSLIRPVTLEDLVNFKPAPGVDHMEPNGWMIVGLDTNFYATVDVQVEEGDLLGQRASVRFTPVRYHWSYGDGSAAVLRTKGATWAAQGVHEFDRTLTSHVYVRQGAYDIDLSIDFAAEYRYAGSGWAQISGTIPVPANRLHAGAGDAKTVLVQRECTVKPVGPGC